MMNADQIHLIEGTFGYAVRNRDAFAKQFYANLIATAPDVETYFEDVDFESQQRKLILAMVAIVDSLAISAELDRTLDNIGQAHKTMPLERTHFDIFQQVFTRTLASFSGDSWNDETQAAWDLAFARIIPPIIAGMTRD